jgi:hypothetical protein
MRNWLPDLADTKAAMFGNNNRPTAPPMRRVLRHLAAHANGHAVLPSTLPRRAHPKQSR